VRWAWPSAARAGSNSSVGAFEVRSDAFEARGGGRIGAGVPVEAASGAGQARVGPLVVFRRAACGGKPVGGIGQAGHDGELGAGRPRVWLGPGAREVCECAVDKRGRPGTGTGVNGGASVRERDGRKQQLVAGTGDTDDLSRGAARPTGSRWTPKEPCGWPTPPASAPSGSARAARS
jgi:hypothetical protein